MNPEALVRYVKEHFAPPATGGRYTNRTWDRARLICLTAQTKKRIEHLATWLTAQVGHKVYPMQVAAILLELTAKGQ